MVIRLLACLIVSFGGPLLTLGEAHAAVAVIELREQVTVSESRLLTLGDVARIDATTPTDASRLAGITLGPGPTAGRTARIGYDDIRQRLLATGVNLGTIEFRGRQTVQVTAAAPQVVPVRHVEERGPAPVAKGTLDAQKKAVSERLAAAFRRSFRRTDSAAQPWIVQCECASESVAALALVPVEQLRFVPGPIASDRPNLVTVWWLDPSTGERREESVTILLSLARQHLVVKHAVPKGYVLQADDVQWMTTAEGDQRGLSRLSDVLGQETQRALRSGQMLTTDDLAEVAMVRTNDIVTVLARKPGITVRRQFKALAAGSIGETITLVALDDPRVRIQAVVTGYHEAAMSSPGETLSQSPGGRMSGATGEEQDTSARGGGFPSGSLAPRTAP